MLNIQHFPFNNLKLTLLVCALKSYHVFWSKTLFVYIGTTSLINATCWVVLCFYVRTGSMGLEDVILTKSPHIRQFTGILGFLFTNSYLTYKHFKSNQFNLEHVALKIALANQLLEPICCLV